MNSRVSSRVGDPTPVLLTDLERLREIRRDLMLPRYGDHLGLLEGKCLTEEQSNIQEARLILNTVVEDVFWTIANSRKGQWSDKVVTKRCTRKNADGDIELGCLLQAPNNDRSCFTGEVIDSLDVPSITRRHEHLISDVIHVTFSETSPPGSVVTIRIPVDHYYVQTWQEVVVRELEPSGIWADVLESSELIPMEDGGKFIYGVQMEVRCDAYIAVVARPTVTSFTLAACDLAVESPVVNDVKVNITASYELDKNPKRILVQVIPMEARTVFEFQEVHKSPLLSAASPLVIVQVEGNTPESMTFTLPMTQAQDDRQSRGLSISNLRTPDTRELQSPTSPSMRSKSPKFLFPPSSLSRSFRMQDHLKEKRTHHLVQLNEGAEMRVKLVEQGEKVFGDFMECREVKCSLYDKGLRLVALETTGSFHYSEIQQLASNFLENLEKHRVLLRVNQDSRNIYKVHLSMEVNTKNSFPVSTHARAPVPSFASRRLIVKEGEAVCVVFRGNVEVSHQQQFLFFSFHGFRGIRRHFDVTVKDPFSQKSLESYHGAVQVWILEDQRTEAVSTRSIPSEKSGWLMKAEFPVILPKYLKKTPLVINRAPLSVSFKEPLSSDIIQRVCREIQHHWYTFGINLGVSHARLQSLKLQNKNVISDKLVRDILLTWWKSQPITSDKISPVIRALVACRNIKLADELRHKRDSAQSAQFQTSSDERTPKAFLALSKHPEVVTRWKDLLEALINSVDQCDDNTSIDDVINIINNSEGDDKGKLLSALELWHSRAKLASVETLEKALKKCKLYGAVKLCR